MARKDSIRSAYERGTLLADAILKFAPENLKRRYRWICKRQAAYGAVNTLKAIQTLRSPSVLESTKDFVAQALGIDWRKPQLSPFCEKDPNRYRRSGHPPKRYPDFYWQQMRSALDTGTRARQYRAFGYETQRKSHHVLMEIPRDVMRFPSIDFEASMIEGNGRRFFRVRLLPISQAESTKKRGPKSRAAEIVDGYNALRSLPAPKGIVEGELRKSVCDKVGDYVVKKTGRRDGLSDDTVWEYVAPLHLTDCEELTR